MDSQVSLPGSLGQHRFLLAPGRLQAFAIQMIISSLSTHLGKTHSHSLTHLKRPALSTHPHLEAPPHLPGLPSQPNFTKTTGKPAQVLNEIISSLKNSLGN